MMLKQTYRFLILCFALAGLSACGGGSGSGPVVMTEILIIGGSSPLIEKKFQLEAAASYSNNTTENITSKVTWKSSNTKIATIDSNGLVNPLTPGVVTFTATFEEITGRKEIEIFDKARIADINITGIANVITQNETAQIQIDAEMNTSDKISTSDEGGFEYYELFSFSSSDDDLLIIDERGNIEAKSFGTVTITASSIDSDVFDEFELIINPGVDNIEVRGEQEQIYIDVGGEKFHHLNVYANLTDETSNNITGQVSWLISDTAEGEYEPINSNTNTKDFSGLHVDANGKITPLARGRFYIKAETDSHVSDNFLEVTIEDPLQLTSLKHDDNEIVLSWNAKVDATEYQLFWDTKEDIDLESENVKTFTEVEEFRLETTDTTNPYFFQMRFKRENDESFSEFSKLLKIQPIRGDWSHKPGLQSLRSHAAAVLYKDDIYIFGGERADENGDVKIVNVVSEFDFENYDKEKPWTQREPGMPVARQGMSACLHGDNIYLFGGKNADDNLSAQILKYLPLNNEWVTVENSLPLALTQTRCSTIGDKIYITGGFSGDVTVNSVYVFDPIAEASPLVEGPALIDARYNHAIENLDGIIYVTGGRNDTGPLDSFELLDTNADTPTWVKSNRLEIARAGHTMRASNETLYVFGGADSEGTALSSVESINLSNTEAAWQASPSMPFPNKDFTLIKRNEIMYFYGGTVEAVTASTLLANAMSYDTLLGNWYPSTSPPISVTGFTSTILDDQLLLIGGKPNLDTTDITNAYDIATGQWSAGLENQPRKPNSPDVERFGATSVHYRDSIYLIGGLDDGSNPIPSVERYEPINNVWLYAGDLKAQRAHACAVVYNDRIYLFGGSVPGENKFGEVLEPKIEIFEPASGLWVSPREMDRPRTGLSCVVVNNLIYLIGGMIEVDGRIEASNTIDIFIPGELRFDRTAAKMDYPRIKPATAVLNNNIYVFGGFDGTFDIPVEIANEHAVARYLPQNNIAPEVSNAWQRLSKLPRLPANFDHLEAHNYQNKILLIGSIVTDPVNGEVENTILFFE